jgi:phosphoribosylformylglycinamidine (FGAM) synthase PurS component
MTTKTALPRHLVEVRLKPEFQDSEGQAALALLHGVGLTLVKECKVSRLYALHGPLNQQQLHQAARDLLSDPVTQEFKILAPAAAALNGMNHWRVEVWLKPTVTDPVGDSVRGALGDLGIPVPAEVRCGVAYRLQGRCGRVLLEKAVSRALANPVVHDFTVTEEHA